MPEPEGRRLASPTDPAVGEEESSWAQINRETARIPWRELQRFFARGRAVAVDRRLDLVDVALRLARDESSQVQEWMSGGTIGRVSDGQARDWFERDAELWAVVVKPWVLVQEAGGETDRGVGL